ncbi:uncharacterized protein Z519_09495 [Cladophialophora bantiana CBS 173.52]|uniref:Uncharacterized protein n=1 Tax=Cladophialophora bantiana (strain ATCC 10958 / CBS 173.52 / CDC B-1940 / NIH 8579) TaxID=1442370 RepID=A0A0D2HZR5_CLAB1|nr:uncharacterized protein Z519_09495 [Cladophialophora bantiana CBS 173.52]KIW90064.1 hypothetical protein Z519_09495 [Cladophialophora bantiana CBS 173.52]
MPRFDQFLASALSLTNENSAALINTKFDFTLFRVEAPAEFAPVGPALSARRRLEAETGSVHRTARRLAALFEYITPSKPHLVSAYGRRVSSIISHRSINPRGSTQDGPFEPFVGADGTAMWAAATSGPGAIGMYLLACMLARAWDSSQAVSIWVELVKTRANEIRSGFENGEHTPTTTLMSTLQDISREDLALWDASARSWLRSADQAKQWHVKQLELVTKDLNIAFSQGPTTYAKVIAAWTQAMAGMEDLLKGFPQQISDASILLAFSAWHLFPDLILLADGVLKIPFRDDLFPENGIGTIGLLPADKSSRGIQWSLTLSHLRYYGGAAEVSSLASQPRVSFGRVRLAVLGCLFFKWRLNRRDFIAAAKFLSGLWEILIENGDRPLHQPVTEQFRWLYTFIQASNDLLLAQSNNTPLYEDYLRIIGFGYRRGREFLGPAEETINPFFGLNNRHVVEALKAAEDPECGVNFLRSVAQASGVEPGNAIILCGHWEEFESSVKNPTLYEYATARPHQILADVVGKGTQELVNFSARWFEPQKTGAGAGALQQRKHAISMKGELVITDTSVSKDDGNNLLWYNPPKLFSHLKCNASNTTSHTTLDQISTQSLGCDCLTGKSDERISFTRGLGSYHCGLYLAQRINLCTDIRIDPLSALDALRSSAHRGTLWSYMSSLAHKSWRQSTAYGSEVGVSLVSKSSKFSSAMCRALHNLAIADIVFEPVTNPTIHLKCLSSPLHEVSWAPKIIPREGSMIPENDSDIVPMQCRVLNIQSRMHTPICSLPTRQQALSCIIFFDSGSIDIDPEELTEVLAVSAGNSLYAPSFILSDPAKIVPEYGFRHIIGNIGRRGISLLVTHQDPQIRPLGDDYRMVNHAPYDSKREDNFTGTSFHLSFTEYAQPLASQFVSNIIDQEVYFVGSVLSVRDRGNWVADLNILEVDFKAITKFNRRADCTCGGQLETSSNTDITSIDSWEELLDSPSSTAIVRAHGNWPARLAAIAVLFQCGHGHCVGIFGEEPFCLNCMQLENEKSLGRAGFQEYESNLPQFCID